MGLNTTAANIPYPPQPAPADIAYRQQRWYAAYMEALFEADRKQMAERIHHARQLIFARERELFNQPGESQEQRALNNALHAMQALSSCFNL
jgi:hypothetical protein